MPGGEQTCDQCQETYHGGTDLAKYGCRCRKAKYTAARANRGVLNDVQPEAPADGQPIGERVQCQDCWGYYNKGTDLRRFGCPCIKAQLEAVFAEPEKKQKTEGADYCSDPRCYEKTPCPVHSAGCCPPSAIPRRAPGPHQPKGEYKVHGDLEIYSSGVSKNGMGVLVVQEIFGIKMGNLAEICDWFADQGFAVLMVDWHRGQTVQKDFSNFGKWMADTPWSKIHADFDKTVLPLFHEKKATRIGVLGFCYGSWVMMKLAGTGKIKAGAASHPSHPKLGPLAGDDLKKLAEDVQCPVAVFSAGDDQPLAKPGGEDESIIKAKFPTSMFKEFKEMKHGWVARGDFTKEGPELQQAQEALQLHLEFFKSNL